MVQGLDRAFQRRRQVTDHRVQQRLDTLVFVGRPKENGGQLLAEHRLANNAIDELQGKGLFGQQKLHHLVAIHRHRFQQMLAGGFDLLDHVGRDRLAADRFAVITVEIQGFFAEQVDNALEIMLEANGKLHQYGVAAELAAELFNHFLGVAAGAVHLVDERQTGNAIAPHLPVNRQRLGLHPTYGAKNEDRPIQDAEASFDFDSEVDVARRVDEVDVVAVPLDRGRGAGDRDATLPLQVHVVHRGAGAAALDFLHAVDTAGIVQHPLAESGLPGIDVGRNANVTEFAQVHVRLVNYLRQGNMPIYNRLLYNTDVN